jgi:hypothetical protein
MKSGSEKLLWLDMGLATVHQYSDYKSAYDVFSQSLKCLPNHGGLIYNLGLASYMRGDFDKSLSWFLKLRELKKNDPDTDAMISSLEK